METAKLAQKFGSQVKINKGRRFAAEKGACAMQGVIVIGEECEGSFFIEAVQFPDGSQRTTHFSVCEGEKWMQGHTARCYTVHFDDSDSPAKLYHLRQKGLWFLDDCSG